MASQQRRTQQNNNISPNFIESYNSVIRELNRYFYALNEEYKVRLRQRKLKRLGLRKIAKRQNLSCKDIKRRMQLNKLSHDDVKKISELQKIKNTDQLTREDLSYALLRSKEDVNKKRYLQFLINHTDDQ